ncbi:TrgA family protein [Actibacterium ureilyticum]|uniref:TrgA family protein n=1 Tax=Actibacterium ureilyticum TaxID=1590614 RepID=UPI000BAB208F|nr:TrgA family protein [Actibacterium ureilyticum]
MPTASRLFAAMGFAIVAFFAAEAFKATMPEGSDPGKFVLICVVIGALSGWMIMGRLAGSGYRPAIGQGIRTTAVMLFYVLLVFSIYEMLRQSVRMRYKNPTEAVAGIFDQVSQYGAAILGAVDVIAILLVGGILAAWLSEWASKRWP